MSLSIIAEHCYGECHLWWVPLMASVTYGECHLWWVSLILSVTYAECHLFWASHIPFMLSVIMLNVIMLNVIMLNVIMLSVVTLSVVVPKMNFYLHSLVRKSLIFNLQWHQNNIFVQQQQQHSGKTLI